MTPRCDSRRRPRLRCRIGLTVLSAAGAGLLGAPVTAVQAAPPPGYTLFWSDEFHQGVGNGPDLTSWRYETNIHVNNELQQYVTDLQHLRIVADPQATDGQALQILATSDGGYKSGRLNSSGKRVFQYGFIEGRIRLPYGQGIWPAFWMLGTNIDKVGWPACGENDIMENIGKRTWWGQNQSSLHSARNGGGTFDTGDKYTLPEGKLFKDGYHLFQCLWQQDTISFYIDGNLYGTRTAAEFKEQPYPFNAPMFFILNLAVGGGWPGNPDSTTIFPQKLLVDYVRVYHGTLRKPSIPSRLTATPADGGQIALNWPTAVGATSYTLYRSSAAGGEAPHIVREGVTAGAFVDTGLTPGVTYRYSVAAVNSAGASARSVRATAVAPRAVEAPYSGKPAPIPGTIGLADYDRGGEGVGYHDNDPENQGGSYRLNDGVDVQEADDPGSPYNIGYSAAGEWLRYTVRVAAAGAYTVTFRVASATNGGTIHLEDAAGHNLTGSVTVPPTGGWQKWITVTAPVTLRAGRQVLKLVEDTGGYNLHTMSFVRR